MLLFCGFVLWCWDCFYVVIWFVFSMYCFELLREILLGECLVLLVFFIVVELDFIDCCCCDVVCCWFLVMVMFDDVVFGYLLDIDELGCIVMVCNDEGWCVVIDFYYLCCMIYL